MNNQDKRINVALPEDLAEDVDYIAEMLSQRTGAKIGRTNAIRAATKAWFDTENNG
jgi:metal-responsive CopG/Arc/MetJ family transcriptional regulator|tara:strand:- start:19653 stop:19820 length:168 start_codon:yes stop_codon:yes gene_type:complete